MRTAKGTLACLLFLSACGEMEAGGGEVCAAVKVEGEVVDFLHVEDEVVCAASFEAVESHVRWVADAWGHDVARVQYELFPDRSHPCWPCPAQAGACAGEGRLATTRLPDRHETAHASHGKLCSSLIEEGWATLYSSPFEEGAMDGSLVDVIAAIEEIGRLPGKYYPFAARFLAFVIDQFGVDAVRELCPMRLHSKAELEAGLQAVLGMTLEETQSALDDYPAWSLGQLRQDQACEIGSAMPVPVTTVLQLGCDAGGVEGLLGRRAWNHVSVDIDEEGWYRLEFETLRPTELWFELRSCEREGLASTHYEIDIANPKPGFPAVLVLQNLQAGRYVIRAMTRESEADLPVSITLEQWL